ncbi:MAG: hypothetical protein E7262_00070 [Lachnospiraceae bacterium]|nr:hypothetical protein [Lachnospiraceae bacterium]
MKKSIICTIMLIFILVINDSTWASNGYNYWTNQEYFSDFWWRYKGTIQFVPSYKTTKESGYGLKSGENVKQAYINYTRKKDGKDESVCGGRHYTKKAKCADNNSTYKVTANASDSLNIFTNKTKFWYNWIYF